MSAVENTPVIDVRALSCKSGTNYLLHDVSWQVQRGEHWVVFGLNGSGKTTLLGAVAGFQPYTHGTVRVFGEEYNDDNIFRLRQRIGFVSSSFFDKVVSEEAVMNIVLSGLFGSLGVRGVVSDRERVEAQMLLAAFGLAEKCDYPFKMLSKGERQNVLIARALLVRPEILILDEPGTGLDVLAREKTLYMVQQLARETGTAIIYVTHYPEELRPEFDHCLMLRRGRVFKKGATQELFSEDVLNTFFEEDVKLHYDTDGNYVLRASQPSALYDLLQKYKANKQKEVG